MHQEENKYQIYLTLLLTFKSKRDIIILKKGKVEMED